MEPWWKKYNKPSKKFSRVSRKNEMDVENKRLARLYPFLSNDQIKCKAKDNLKVRNRADVYEFDADSDEETSFPKKDVPSSNKAKMLRAKYKPLSVMTMKDFPRTKNKKTKVIEVIDLSSDSDNEIVEKRDDFDWRSVKIKTEKGFDIAVKSDKKAEDKVEKDMGMRYEKSKKESDFDKLLLTATKYVRNPEHKVSEKSDEQEGWRPFMGRKRTYVRNQAPITDNQNVKISETKTEEKNEELRSVKSKPKIRSSDIQEPSTEFKDKAKYFQPGEDIDSWEATDRLNSEEFKIKTDFSGYSSEDSVPEVKNISWKKSNASKFLKLDSENTKINISRKENSKVNKYLDPHFYTNKFVRNHSNENQSGAPSTANQLFHQKIWTKATATVSTPFASKGSEKPKSGTANWSPIKILMNNNRLDEVKARKDTALTDKLQSLKAIPEDSNSLNKILQAVYKVRETEEERRTMDQKTLRAKRVSFADGGGFLSSLFD